MDDASATQRQCEMLGDDPGYLCNEEVCAETQIFLCHEPSNDPSVHCELQEGLTMDGRPVWACGVLDGGEPPSDQTGQRSPATRRSGDAPSMLAGDPVDVSDLRLTMADLDQPIPTDGDLAGTGYESVSRLPGADDGGCKWTERADTVEATLTIAGLRGQPAAALDVQATPTTLTLTAFGMAVWSCVLRGEARAPDVVAEVVDESDGVPVVRVLVPKAPNAPRWGGLIQAIGEDSIL